MEEKKVFLKDIYLLQREYIQVYLWCYNRELLTDYEIVYQKKTKSPIKAFYVTANSAKRILEVIISDKRVRELGDEGWNARTIYKLLRRIFNHFSEIDTHIPKQKIEGIILARHFNNNECGSLIDEYKRMSYLTGRKYSLENYGKAVVFTLKEAEALLSYRKEVMAKNKSSDFGRFKIDRMVEKLYNLCKDEK